MQFDGLLCLEDGYVELSLTNIVILLVAHLIERQQYGVIIC